MLRVARNHPRAQHHAPVQGCCRADAGAVFARDGAAGTLEFNLKTA
jgi:hypothetical protein